MIMCEVLRWSPNWKEQLESKLPWAQLNHSIGSKEVQLRPDLNNYRDDYGNENRTLVNLVKSMWSHEEIDRPTMPSVLFRLRAIRDGHRGGISGKPVSAIAYRKMQIAKDLRLLIVSFRIST